MTAKIKLNAASGGGSFSLQAPSSSANNRVFTLPDSADATILTSTASLGKFASYAIIADQKTAGTSGGTFTSGAWRVRDLNTEITDADGIVSISSNKFTLQAGTYLIKVSAPAFRVSKHMARLENDTDGTVVAYGTSEHTLASNEITTRSIIMYRGTITGAKAFEVSHQCQDDKSGNGFGIENNGHFAVDHEKYTIVEIYKES
jgi:hypothetical protein